MNKLDKEYKDWLIELKSKIRSSQIKAAIAVNTALIEFYWELGKKWRVFPRPIYTTSNDFINFMREMNFSTSLVEKYHG